MGKYEVYVCSCGRIHLMDRSNFDWLSNNYTKRSVIQICNNCGAARETFLDEYMDGFAVCKEEIKDVKWSIVDVLPEEDIAKCKALSESTGIKLRIRHFT